MRPEARERRERSRGTSNDERRSEGERKARKRNYIGGEKKGEKAASGAKKHWGERSRTDEVSEEVEGEATEDGIIWGRTQEETDMMPETVRHESTKIQETRSETEEGSEMKIIDIKTVSILEWRAEGILDNGYPTAGEVAGEETAEMRYGGGRYPTDRRKPSDEEAKTETLKPGKVRYGGGRYPTTRRTPSDEEAKTETPKSGRMRYDRGRHITTRRTPSDGKAKTEILRPGERQEYGGRNPITWGTPSDGRAKTKIPRLERRRDDRGRDTTIRRMPSDRGAGIRKPKIEEPWHDGGRYFTTRREGDDKETEIEGHGLRRRQNDEERNIAIPRAPSDKETRAKIEVKSDKGRYIINQEMLKMVEIERETFESTMEERDRERWSVIKKRPGDRTATGETVQTGTKRRNNGRCVGEYLTKQSVIKEIEEAYPALTVNQVNVAYHAPERIPDNGRQDRNSRITQTEETRKRKEQSNERYEITRFLGKAIHTAAGVEYTMYPSREDSKKIKDWSEAANSIQPKRITLSGIPTMRNDITQDNKSGRSEATWIETELTIGKIRGRTQITMGWGNREAKGWEKREKSHLGETENNGSGTRDYAVCRMVNLIEMKEGRNGKIETGTMNDRAPSDGKSPSDQGKSLRESGESNGGDRKRRKLGDENDNTERNNNSQAKKGEQRHRGDSEDGRTGRREEQRSNHGRVRYQHEQEEERRAEESLRTNEGKK